jgi:hypothetical protein
MKISITGKIGRQDVDLTVEADTEELKEIFSQTQIVQIPEASNSQSADDSTAKAEPDVPQQDDAPIVRSRPEAKTSELSSSLAYIEAKKEVTQYQLIDHLADNGHSDASIKRAIMWLKHHADIKVDTVSQGEHSQYYVFRWIAG